MDFGELSVQCRVRGFHTITNSQPAVPTLWCNIATAGSVNSAEQAVTGFDIRAFPFCAGLKK